MVLSALKLCRMAATFSLRNKASLARRRFLLSRNDNKPCNVFEQRRCYMTPAERDLLAEQQPDSTSQSPNQQQLYSEKAARELLNRHGGGEVRLEKCDKSGIARLILDHPEKKNAFSGRMMLQLAELVAQLSAWSNGRVVVVRGSGNDFCTGGDLEFVKQGMLMSTFMTNTLHKLYALPLISVAMVEGNCLGGGAELAMGCDLRIAHRSARIGYVHGRMGVSPGWGGGTRLVQLVGRAKALKAMAAGEVYSGEQAEKLGMVDNVFSSDDEAEKWLKDLTKNTSTVTSRASKWFIQQAVHCTPNESLVREAAVFSSLWGSEHHRRILEQPPKHRDS